MSDPPGNDDQTNPAGGAPVTAPFFDPATEDGADSGPVDSALQELVERLTMASAVSPVQLGQYDVIGTLGRGGMGRVYQAIDRVRGNRVALKTVIVPDNLAAQRLKHEFRAVAEIGHPNLASAYELVCESDLWFFSMECIDGIGFREWARGASDVEGTNSGMDEMPTRPDRPADLDYGDVAIENVSATGPLVSYGEVRGAFGGLIQGLARLHQTGLVHGDVKPGNVLVTADGDVVVVDFGLTHDIHEGNDRDPVESRGGTPTYMAPELLNGDRGGPEADWYAAGVMLYQVLTGRLPFAPGGGAVGQLVKKTAQLPPSPLDLVSSTPRDLSEICMAMLRPKAELRPKLEALAEVFLDGRDDIPLSLARVPFVGRKQELDQLDSALDAAERGQCTMVHLSGPSGIGKSSLVRRFSGRRGLKSVLILSGRCFERERLPYKAFDGVLDQFAAHLRAREPDARAASLDGCAELVQVFPALGTAFAPTTTATEDPLALRRRSWRALRTLVREVAAERLLVICIDDLQWVDEDSAALLEHLTQTQNLGLLVICSFRTPDAEWNPPLREHLERTASNGVSVVDLQLQPLAEQDAVSLAESLLHRAGAMDDPGWARDVAREGRGVPFFVEELARFAAVQGRQSGPISLKDAITARIQRLTADERALIQATALAERLPQSVLIVSMGRDIAWLQSLVGLVNQSMLSWTGPGPYDIVSIYHDRIRESVLEQLSEEERARWHHALGHAFWASYLEDPDNAWLFEAVRHLGEVASQLTGEERQRVARLHLVAGRVARSHAAFPLAFSCFERGRRLLETEAWTEDYPLMLGMCLGVVETGYLTASWIAYESALQDVKAHARAPMDQVLAWEVEIDVLAGRQEFGAAVRVATTALEALGVSIPSEPSREDVGAAVQRGLQVLQGMTPTRLQALPDVTDPEVSAAMRLQVRLAPAAYFAKPSLLPIIAANLISTSADKGLSPATPYALGLFGIVLNSIGMYPLAHQWGVLALDLLPRWSDRRSEAATRHVVVNLVCNWMVPLHTTLDASLEVFDIGRETGDLEYGAYAAHAYVHNAFYSARPLDTLVVKALELGREMAALGQVNATHVHGPFEQQLKCWTGRKSNPEHLDDDGFSEADLMALATTMGSRSGIFILRLNMGLTRYAFGDPRDAVESFLIAMDHLDAAPSVWHIPILHQHFALAVCALWNDLQPDGKDTLRPRVEASLEVLETLAGHAPINFQHRVHMVRGALLAADGDIPAAESEFEAAIRSSEEGGWRNDRAHAYEWLARLSRTPDKRRAAHNEALRLYAEWGATTKVEQLTVAEQRVSE